MVGGAAETFQLEFAIGTGGEFAVDGPGGEFDEVEEAGGVSGEGEESVEFGEGGVCALRDHLAFDGATEGTGLSELLVEDGDEIAEEGAESIALSRAGEAVQAEAVPAAKGLILHEPVEIESAVFRDGVAAEPSSGHWAVVAEAVVVEVADLFEGLGGEAVGVLVGVGAGGGEELAEGGVGVGGGGFVGG